MDKNTFMDQIFPSFTAIIYYQRSVEMVVAQKQPALPKTHLKSKRYFRRFFLPAGAKHAFYDFYEGCRRQKILIM